MGDLQEEIRKVVKEEIPDWLWNLKTLATDFKDFAQNPRQSVVGVFVALLLFLANTMANFISDAFDLLQEPFETVAATLGSILADPAAALLNVLATFNETAQQLVLNSGIPGPLQPAVLVLLMIAEIAVLYYAGKAFLGVIR